MSRLTRMPCVLIYSNEALIKGTVMKYFKEYLDNEMHERIIELTLETKNN